MLLCVRYRYTCCILYTDVHYNNDEMRNWRRAVRFSSSECIGVNALRITYAMFACLPSGRYLHYVACP